MALKSVTFPGRFGPKSKKASKKRGKPATAAWADLAAVGDIVTKEGWADGRDQ